MDIAPFPRVIRRDYDADTSDPFFIRHWKALFIPSLSLLFVTILLSVFFTQPWFLELLAIGATIGAGAGFPIVALAAIVGLVISAMVFTAIFIYLKRDDAYRKLVEDTIPLDDDVDDSSHRLMVDLHLTEEDRKNATPIPEGGWSRAESAKLASVTELPQMSNKDFCTLLDYEKYPKINTLISEKNAESITQELQQIVTWLDKNGTPPLKYNFQIMIMHQWLHNMCSLNPSEYDAKCLQAFLGALFQMVSPVGDKAGVTSIMKATTDMKNMLGGGNQTLGEVLSALVVGLVDGQDGKTDRVEDFMAFLATQDLTVEDIQFLREKIVDREHDRKADLGFKVHALLNHEEQRIKDSATASRATTVTPATTSTSDVSSTATTPDSTPSSSFIPTGSSSAEAKRPLLKGIIEPPAQTPAVSYDEFYKQLYGSDSNRLKRCLADTDIDGFQECFDELIEICKLTESNKAKAQLHGLLVRQLLNVYIVSSSVNEAGLSTLVDYCMQLAERIDEAGSADHLRNLQLVFDLNGFSIKPGSAPLIDILASAYVKLSYHHSPEMCKAFNGILAAILKPGDDFAQFLEKTKELIVKEGLRSPTQKERLEINISDLRSQVFAKHGMIIQPGW